MSTVRTEKRERTAIGKLIKWGFIGFNLFMVVWIAGGLHSVSKMPMHSAAQQIGAGIGATIGVTMLLVLWALGDLILGTLVLVTRGDKVIIEESISSFTHSSSTSPTPSFDMSRVDERIAQLKAEASAAPRTPLPTSAPSAPSFGKRRA